MFCFNVERFCLSCHGDALWADTSGGNRLCGLVLLLMYACAHVRPTQTQTHTDQCTERCLWTTAVTYRTSTSAGKDRRHPRKRQSVHIQRTSVSEGEGPELPTPSQTNGLKHLPPNWRLYGLTGSWREKNTTGGFLFVCFLVRKQSQLTSVMASYVYG